MSEQESQIAGWSGPLERLGDPLAVPMVERVFDVSVRPPGSKSITNRALLLAALAEGESVLRGALVEADDARVMVAALRQLGAGIEVDGDVVRVVGVGGRWKIARGGAGEEVRLDLHNAGTATRFLTAAALLAPAGTSVVIDGDARMRERPIGELVRTLNIMAEDRPCAEYLGRQGFPPVRVRPDHASWVSGMVQSFGRTQSSQFVSAVLLVAPFLEHGLEFRFTTDDVTSRSYIDMTLGMLRRLGVEITAGMDGGTRIGRAAARGEGRFAIDGFTLDVEPDASGATYFQAAAALVPGASVTIEGLDLHPSEGRASLQGDTQFVRVLTAMGARVERLNKALRVTGPERLRGVDVDLSDMPDTAMTAAVLACFAEGGGGPSVLRGLRTLRVKETDRLEALRVELTKIGAGVEIFKDGEDEGLRITPVVGGSEVPSKPHYSAQSSGVVAREEGREEGRVVFETYKDHRMAMALALVGLRRPGVFIRDPGCVAKTYPTFWRDLAKIYA